MCQKSDFIKIHKMSKFSDGINSHLKKHCTERACQVRRPVPHKSTTAAATVLGLPRSIWGSGPYAAAQEAHHKIFPWGRQVPHENCRTQAARRNILVLARQKQTRCSGQQARSGFSILAPVHRWQESTVGAQMVILCEPGVLPKRDLLSCQGKQCSLRELFTPSLECKALGRGRTRSSQFQATGGVKLLAGSFQKLSIAR